MPSFQFKGFNELYSDFLDILGTALLKKHQIDDFNQLDKDRKEQINRVISTYEDLRKLPRLTDADRALILAGVLLTIHAEIQKSYYWSSPHNSETYKQIYPTLGVSETNPLDATSVERALAAAQKYNEQKNHLASIANFNAAQLKHVATVVRQNKAVLSKTAEEIETNQRIDHFEQFKSTTAAIQAFQRKNLHKVRGNEKHFSGYFNKSDYVKRDKEFQHNERTLIKMGFDRIAFDGLKQVEPTYNEVQQNLKLFDQKVLRKVAANKKRKIDATWADASQEQVADAKWSQPRR